MTAGLPHDLPPLPAVLDARVSHRRTRPLGHAFRHRTTAWLVDVDAPEQAFPRWLRRLHTVRAEDHLAPGPGTLREKLDHALAEQDTGWTAHRAVALTGARTLGYAFDPLTTYFVLDAGGRLEGVLAEVHNTYGERHLYPLPAGPEASAAPRGARADSRVEARVDARVDAQVDKEFYVSPFFTVHGRYDIRARLDRDRVAVTVALTQDGTRVFSGTIAGRPRPATRAAVLRAVARRPFAAQRVSALIRMHGVWLWLRRLPVVRRSPHVPPPGLRPAPPDQQQSSRPPRLDHQEIA